MFDGETVVRTRSSPGGTLPRLGVRRVLACPVFSSAPSLRSTNSDFGRPTPFAGFAATDRKSTRLNSSHLAISYAVFCLDKETARFGLLRRAASWVRRQWGVVRRTH